MHSALALPLLVTFGVLAFSAGLAVTLVGLPLLVLTLAAARGLGRVERARARAL